MIAPQTPSSLIGQTLADRYRIERLVGEGGMGQVYLAHHVRTDRPLAVKLLAPEAAQEPENLQRFEREAKTLGALGHPNIVGIHDFAEAPDGRPFLVMDYLEGEDLLERMAGDGAMPWEAARVVFDQIAAALHAAHCAGVLHRDLKPGNIFLARGAGTPERVVLLDFGLAKSVSAEEARVTRTGLIMGTPLYMSPEQARGGALDVRSDVYSLAAVLFEMLAGRPPFEGDTWTAILSALLVDPPPVLSQHVPANLPPHLDEVLVGALSKDPDHRPPDVASYAAAVLQERPVWADRVTGPSTMDRTAPAGVPATMAPLPRAAEDAVVGTRVLRDAGRKRAPWIVLVVLLLVGGVAAGLAIGWAAKRKPAAGTSPKQAARPLNPNQVPPTTDAAVSLAVSSMMSASMVSPSMAAAMGPEAMKSLHTTATGPRPRISMRPPPRPPRRGSKGMAPRVVPRRTQPEARPRLTRADILAALPANERAAVKAMKTSSWAACVKATYRPPVSSRILQMRVSCGLSGRRYSDVRRACTTFRKRYPSHPFARSCVSILRGLNALPRAMRSTP